jgi:4-amino-4-deoxy-L-arabinose transferase-like glycosyltransferase
MPFSSHKLKITLLVGIALLGLAVRLLTFDRYLPFMDYTDESNMYLLARDWRGVEDVPVVPEWLAGYPPLYIWLSMGVQQIVESGFPRPWIFPSDYFYYTRFVAAILGSLTVLVTMRLGWQLGGFVAAAFAGSIWALSPFVVDYNSLAIPDPLVYLGCAIAFVTAIEAWKSKSPRWLLASLLAGIAVTYTKYPAVFVLIPWAVTTLALLYQKPRDWWRWVLLYLGTGLAAAAYLVFGYGAFTLSNREANSVRNDLVNIFDLNRQLNNWYYAILPVGTVFFVAICACGILAYFISRKRGWRTLNRFPIALILLSGLVGISITTTYTNIALPAGKIRHSLPITVGIVGLWAANISQIYWTLQNWAQSRKQNQRTALPKVAISALGVVIGIWLLTGSIGSVQTFSVARTEAIAQEYADSSLPADGLLLMRAEADVERIFNRAWGGYSGATAFEWWLEANPTLSTPAELAERGITYFVVGSDDWNNPNLHDDLKNFTAQLTPLRTISAGQDYLGEDITFYRILPPQVTVDVSFGSQIALAGYDLSHHELRAGETLLLRPYWRSLEQIEINYSMFVHLYPETSLNLVTQYDGSPALPSRSPVTWQDRNELIMGSSVSLTIPDNTPSGAYVLALGIYDYGTGARLQTPSGDHFAIPINIES